jgi:hypothetical protein
LIWNLFNAVALAVARVIHAARTERAATSVSRVRVRVSRVCELTCVTVITFVLPSLTLNPATAVQVLSEHGEVVHGTVVHVVLFCVADFVFIRVTRSL